MILEFIENKYLKEPSNKNDERHNATLREEHPGGFKKYGQG